MQIKFTISDAMLCRWRFYSAPRLEPYQPPQRVDGNLPDVLARLALLLDKKAPDIKPISRNPVYSDRIWGSDGWKVATPNAAGSAGGPGNFVKWDVDVRSLYDTVFVRVGVQLTHDADERLIQDGAAFNLFNRHIEDVFQGLDPELGDGSCLLARVTELPQIDQALVYVSPILDDGSKGAIRCVQVDAGLLCFGVSPFRLVLFHEPNAQQAANELIQGFVPECFLSHAKRIRRHKTYLDNNDSMHAAERRLFASFPDFKTEAISLDQLEKSATDLAGTLTGFTVLLNQHRETFQTLCTNLSNLETFDLVAQTTDAKSERGLDQWIYGAIRRDVHQIESDIAYFEASDRSFRQALAFLQFAATLRTTQESRQLATSAGKAVGEIAETQRKLEFVESFIVAVYAVELFHNLGSSFGFDRNYIGRWLIGTAVSFGLVALLLLAFSPDAKSIHATAASAEDRGQRNSSSHIRRHRVSRRLLGIILISILIVEAILFLAFGFKDLHQDQLKPEGPPSQVNTHPQ